MRHIFAALLSVLFVQGANAQPVRIGSTLALTGPLAATASIHKIAGEVYIDWLNKRGGMLGRPVEWVLKDDQSRPDLARSLYEQLVTVDKVDLVMGPYATGPILSAMGVAQRYNKVLVHHTFGTPQLAKYEMQFSASGSSGDPENVWPNLAYDALAASSRPPKTVAILTSKFPSMHFVSLGAREVAKKRGLAEVLYLEWEFGNRDFGPIANRVKDARPDFLWVGALGLEGNLLIDAMKKLDYSPPLQLYTFPAPGPMARSPDANHALALTTFEEHPPFTNSPVAAELIKLYHERAARAGLPDTTVESHAAASWAAWQVLAAGVAGAKSLDDRAIAQWLKNTAVDTLIGRLRWDGPNNYILGNDVYKVKQLQNGKWQVVWPREFAAPGAKLITQ